MPRIEDLIAPHSSAFADDYDVYVDYGQGRPMKMNNDEATFIDVERFLLNQFDSVKMLPDQRSRPENKGSTVLDSSAFTLATRDTRPTDTKVEAHPRSKPTQLSRSSSSLSGKELTRISDITKILTKGTGLYHSASQRNPRHQKLSLRIAVNGASKDMRGQCPASNRSLIDGDFGDDAGMFVDNEDTSFVALADGAGGNRSLGLNPADFSQAILATCRRIAVQKCIQTHQLPSLVVAALRQVEASTVRGSSTFCLLALDRQEPVLTSLNIGDSGFVIYRQNTIYRRSECTTDPHSGGPRQLFALGDHFGLPDFHQEKTFLEASSLDRIPVQKDDLIILASDGLWDVIEADQLQRIVERHRHRPLQDLASDLLAEAMRGYASNSRDDILIIACRVEERCIQPFARLASDFVE